MLGVIVVQVLAFLGLVGLLRWLFYRNVTATMQRLDLLYRENLKRDQELRGRIEAVEKECQAKRQEAEHQVTQILEAGKQEAEFAREEVLRAARQEGQRLVQEAHERREEIRRELEREMDQKVIQLASDAIRYVLTTKVEEGMHSQLVDELLDAMAALDAGQLGIQTAQAEVIAPRPLSPDQRARLQKILSQKAGRSVTMKDSQDDRMIAGLLVRMDHLVLDGTLRNKLREAVAYVRKSRLHDSA